MAVMRMVRSTREHSCSRSRRAMSFLVLEVTVGIG
jgi:hypothetical protein